MSKYETLENLFDLAGHVSLRDGGVLVWQRDVGRGRAGDEVGYLDLDGYLRFRFRGHEYRAHRVVFALTRGAWPKGEVDHLNGRRRDNRPENLRDVPRRTNAENRRSATPGSGTGFLGVSHFGRRYRAQITVKGKKMYLGGFDTPEAAHQAYLDVKRAFHDGNTL